MMEENDKERIQAIAANYVQLCGTLAGFSGGFIIFLLSPGLFPQRTSEISIIFLLLAGFSYTYSAGWSALIPNMTYEDGRQKLKLADTTFLFANVFLWIAFAIILFSLGYIWASILSVVFLILSIASGLFQKFIKWLYSVSRSRKGPRRH